MPALPGSKAGFWVPTPGSSSQAFTGQAMTRVDTTQEYYITDRTKCWWDPDRAVTVKDAGTAVPGCQVDHNGGFITLPTGYTPTGAITVDGYSYTTEALAGGYGVSLDPKSGEADITCFSSVLNQPVQWKRFVSTLKEFTVTVKRHWFFACAFFVTVFGAANSNLVWSWKTPGAVGNGEALRYIVSGNNTPLSVARAAGVTTVTVATNGSGQATSTATLVKAAVMGDATLSQLWDVQYAAGNNGSGVVAALAQTYLSGGRDSDELARLAKKVLCVVYLDITTGCIKKLEGVGILTGISPEVKVEQLVEADLTFRGDDRLRYHEV